MASAPHRTKLEHLEISSIGLGTYLGPCDSESDVQLRAVLQRAHELGINFVDTAANYRGGRSERVIGEFLRDLPKAEADRWVVATKLGFLPGDPDPATGSSDQTYFTRTYLRSGVVRPEALFGEWQCYHPSYLNWQAEQSFMALGRRRIDILYFHNPEAALLTTTRAEFEAIMRQAFRWGGAMVRGGCVKYLGLATWGGLLGTSEKEAIDLVELSTWAREEGAGEALRFVQAPVSIGMPQAFLKKSQRLVSGEAASLVRCAAALGYHVIGSAPFLNGKLHKVSCPPELKDALALHRPSQAYLEFARSVPGVGATLVGTLSIAHLEEAAELLGWPPQRDRVINFLGGGT